MNMIMEPGTTVPGEDEGVFSDEDRPRSDAEEGEFGVQSDDYYYVDDDAFIVDDY